MPSMQPLTDNFSGDTPHLIRCIEALLMLNANGALAPRGLPGHARTLLSASVVRLSQCEALVARFGDVDQRVPVSAARADEEAPVFVQLGGDGQEHDGEVAAPASPHVADGTAGAGAPYCAKLAGPCSDGCAGVKVACSDRLHGDCWRVKPPPIDGVNVGGGNDGR